MFDCEDEDGRVRNICVSSTVGRWHRIHVSLGRKQGDSNWHQPSHQFQIHTMGGPCDDLSFNADNSFYLLQSNKTRWSINSRIVFSFLRSIIVFFFILVFLSLVWPIFDYIFVTKIYRRSSNMKQEKDEHLVFLVLSCWCYHEDLLLFQ